MYGCRSATQRLKRDQTFGGATGVGGGLGHRELGAVPPAADPMAEERGVRGFVDMV